MSTMTSDRRYRVVPAERAGYGPGLFVVQYYDQDARVWFDHGDPLPERDARERAAALRKQ